MNDIFPIQSTCPGYNSLSYFTSTLSRADFLTVLFSFVSCHSMNRTITPPPLDKLELQHSQ
ncbi:hypothetical protein NXZ84_01375 [Mechercharimyces sp. CAU 1602]|nr:hypothetical protein [Mechercharimyces sp. CAU 1602]